MAKIGRLALALLGILAYQNRDKLTEMLKGSRQDGDRTGGDGGLLDQLSKGVAGTPLGDILDRFRNSGAGAKVDSWVGKGPNEPIEPQEVERAIDEETLAALQRQTGMSREELIERLTRELPAAVDRMTPDGKLPEGVVRDDSEPSLLDDAPPADARGPRTAG